MTDRDSGLKDFSANLRQLCRRHGFTSRMCRTIGINRQQFARYLSGETLPSSNNLRRICEYLEVSEEELFLPQQEFRQVIRTRKSRLPLQAIAEVLDNLWLKPEPGMPKFTGFYHVYEPSQLREGCISRSLQHIHEVNGRLCVRSVERLLPRGTWYGSGRIRFRGMASVMTGRLVTIQYARHGWQPVVLRVCAPSVVAWRGTLEGVTLSTGSPSERQSHCARSVWISLGSRPDLRAALKRVGVFDRDDSSLEPAIVEQVTDVLPAEMLL